MINDLEPTFIINNKQLNEVDLVEPLLWRDGSS